MHSKYVTSIEVGKTPPQEAMLDLETARLNLSKAPQQQYYPRPKPG